MPGQDGFELLKWLREREMEVDTVLLTSYADFSYARAAVSFQCFEYLLKPVETAASASWLLETSSRCSLIYF